MRENIIYWLWLQCVFGANNKTFKSGMKFFHTAEDFYNASEYDYKICGCFTPSIIAKLSSKDLTKAEKILNDCLREGYDIITYSDRLFSEKLRSISSPPCVLYVKGKMPDIDEKLSVAIVGSREANNEGITAARNFGGSLASSGSVVVSGGALGIDSAAHIGAVKSGGMTVCVLGCGINANYLPENLSLREKISKNGAVVSEFPPGYPAASYNFPIRNRIICGLSDCTLVVQAGEKSGAIITANDAIKEGRKLFAVPGSIFSDINKGSNNLLRRGFSAAVDASDLINWYNSNKHKLIYSSQQGFLEYEAANPKADMENIIADIEQESAGSENSDIAQVDSHLVQKNRSAPISKIEKKERTYPTDISEQSLKILKVINEIPVTTDYISEKTGISINLLLSSLTELEIFGYIESVVGGKYILK